MSNWWVCVMSQKPCFKSCIVELIFDRCTDLISSERSEVVKVILPVQAYACAENIYSRVTL